VRVGFDVRGEDGGSGARREDEGSEFHEARVEDWTRVEEGRRRDEGERKGKSGEGRREKSVRVQAETAEEEKSEERREEERERRDLTNR